MERISTDAVQGDEPSAGRLIPTTRNTEIKMISIKAVAAAAVAMVALGSGVAMAKTAKTAATPVVHSPESIECSKQADAKGLHGKDRKKFRASCKKDLMNQHKGEKKS